MSDTTTLPEIPERRYQRPPIVEALCEMYFAGSNWDDTIPGLFYDQVRAEYPGKEQLKGVEVKVEVGPGQAETRTRPAGGRMRFVKMDRSRMLQLAPDVLVFNQLQPYPHYEEWREVVHKMLDLYRGLASPAGLNRIGVRYINRFDLPGPTVRMEDYFNVYPKVPDELGGHGAFMLQLLLHPVCPGHQLTLSLGVGPAKRPEDVGFWLDLYDVVELGGQDRFADVRRLLDEAHANVAHTFENAITDKSRGLFGEISHE